MLQASALPGTVWLPDEEGRLAPAASMHYNDAPWLLESALRLVNKGIPNPLADQLGVQSLRFHHQVSVSFWQVPSPELCTASDVSFVPACWPSSSSLLPGISTQHLIHHIAARQCPSHCSHHCLYDHKMSTKMTTPLPCPSAKTLADLLEGQQFPLSMLLGDIVEMADAAGCESLEVVLDQRQHGQQSLLHPGLAGQQGPALCFKLQGDKMLLVIP